MLEILNKTPFRAAIVPVTDKDDHDFAVVVLKGAFLWDRTGVAVPADEQVEIAYGDEYWGEPGQSSVKYASDVCLRKPGADVALIGKVYAPRGATSLDVGLRVGQAKAALKVFGDRHWYRGLVGWEVSEPKKFTEMPLVYERAYGGADTTDPEQPANDPRNPVGRGFSARGEGLEGAPLPNLEAPESLISSWDSRPAPRTFAFVDRSWSPRVEHAGTYDERWKKERCPLLPSDFDDRFHQAAHPSLIYPGLLAGGEVVQATSVSPAGGVSFTLPRYHVTADTWIRGERRTDTLSLDTVVIEPDLDRVTLTWRAAIPCTRKFLFIDGVALRAKEGDARPRRR